jgi:hypothetical protein|eukprot:COSAG02_NODE_230_length_28060_cov_5.226816_11_plen_178_part_00
MVKQGPVEAIHRDGLRLQSASHGSDLIPCDAVVLGTGYRHGLMQLLEPTLADIVLTKLSPSTQERLPVTDGRCQSVAEPTLYFVGFDTTLAYGLSWGHWVRLLVMQLNRQTQLCSSIAFSTQAMHAPEPWLTMLCYGRAGRLGSGCASSLTLFDPLLLLVHSRPVQHRRNASLPTTH